MRFESAEQKSVRNSHTRRVRYEDLAREYYDSARHPTCQNFRAGSELYLKQTIEISRFDQCSVCELGAGSSLVAEILGPDWIKKNKLTLLDSSASMLAYSSAWAQFGAQLLIANAEDTALDSSSFDFIVSSLGDPYNTRALWFEISRILRPGGFCHFTIPSFSWASEFRSNGTEDHLDVAEFILKTGESVAVQSLIYPVEKQIDLIQSSGLSVIETSCITIRDLPSMPISPKLLVSGTETLPIVDCYTMQKPHPNFCSPKE